MKTKKKTYIIECFTSKDGVTTMSRKIDGFTPLELLGVLELTRSEILAQMRGEIKPDIIKRQVIE